jgi:hypothetical protein
MTASTMKLGPLGNFLDVPWPESGMNWNMERTAEVTNLISGGRSVYLSPTPYRSYKMSWKGGTPGLSNLVDLYNGVYGTGPFYVLDPNYRDTDNLLPTRWATSSMLHAVAGSWCQPLVVSGAGLDGLAANFANPGTFPELGVKQTVALSPGVPVSVMVWGSASGGAGITLERLTDAGVWESLPDYVPTSSPAGVALAPDTGYQAVRLGLRVPSGGSLTVAHASVAQAPSKTPGRGVGAVLWSGALSGNIVTRTFDRIGLALDMVEIEQ